MGIVINMTHTQTHTVHVCICAHMHTKIGHSRVQSLLFVCVCVRIITKSLVLPF